ncbi:MAG TPA: hypothetical protein ENO22_08900 [candidate division Zixibacteria bacterium]|nr:hypothetical protein [candidate division Zixibacteria bacterium]HEQ99440.1 hypothetical protein [candidate division Zixibacteria bacterium]
MNPADSSLIEMSVAGFLILSIFSFLYKDNPFYRLAEHIFAGLTAGYYVGLIYQTVIVQQLTIPIYREGKLELIFPALLGILMFTRFFDRFSYLSRISLAFVMGNTAGIFLIQQLHGLVLPQTQATIINPLAGSWLLGAVPGGMIIIAGVITTLIYFYFSKEHKGVLGKTARVGMVFIMISFGAHFGYTVMARLSLLIGQVKFVAFDWLPRLIGVN